MVFFVMSIANYMFIFKVVFSVRNSTCPPHHIGYCLFANINFYQCICIANARCGVWHLPTLNQNFEYYATPLIERRSEFETAFL